MDINNKSKRMNTNSKQLNNILGKNWVKEEIKKGKENFLELNENTSYQNLWDTVKASPTGKFVAPSAYIKKLDQG